MKYYLMKDKKERVRGEVMQLADESEYHEWVTTHKRTFHGIVDTIEEAERWAEEVYNRDSNETLYAVEVEETVIEVKVKVKD